MTRRMRRTVGVLALGAVLAVAAFVAGPEQAGAFGAPVVDLERRVEYPVEYTVGETLVFSTTHRNPSCSVSRNYRNNADGPVRILSSVIWDGSLAHTRPKPGTSALDGDDILEAGEQGTIVFTNSDHIPSDASGMFLLISVIRLPELAGDVGANSMEAILPCGQEPPVSSTTAPPDVTVSTVPTTVATTTPATAPETVPETTLPSEPAPPFEAVTSTTVGTGVLASNLPARSLPATGVDDWLGVLAIVGAAAVTSGATLVATNRKDDGS